MNVNPDGAADFYVVNSQTVRLANKLGFPVKFVALGIANLFEIQILPGDPADECISPRSSSTEDTEEVKPDRVLPAHP